MASRVEQFQIRVAQQPGNPLFRFSLAQALVNESRGGEAIPHLEQCVASNAEWMMPRIMLGKHLLAAGLIADAKPLLSQALDLAVAQAHEDPASELRALLAGL